LNKILEETEKGNSKLPPNGEIMQKIKKNDLYSASTIIRLAAHYLRNGHLCEFEPEILVGQRLKKPDLRVKFGDIWIYLEESKLKVSLHQKYLHSILGRISKITEKINSNLNIEVLLLKDEFRYEEISDLLVKIKELSTKNVHPQELKIEGLAKIFTYKEVQQKPCVENIRPALCETAFVASGGFVRRLNVQIPFTDVRIKKILEKGKQLSPREHNMIILDISIPGSLEHWSKSTRKLLLSGKHKKIGSVLLVRQGLLVKSLKVNTDLIVHPNALNPLPKEFIQLTNSFFSKHPEYCYRPA